MKTTLLAALFSLSVTSIFAQKQNVIKANIFSPFVKSGSFFYEHAFGNDKSVQLGVGFTSYKPDETKLTGIFITPEFRYYLSEGKKSPDGFYIGPYLRYQNLKIEDTDDKATLTTMGGGIVVGRQWILKDLISIDMFIGPSYNKGTIKYTTTQSANSVDVPGVFNGFGVRTGITFGIAF